ncbi:hypothetical protein EZBTHKR_0578 [Elizabethkingia anophelis]|nr:hypothetical protein EZBTHKR_0578 [Elizabethkingia anophelis]
MLLVYETKIADFQNIKNSAIKNDRVLYILFSVSLIFE